jgi:hypothetical protein
MERLNELDKHFLPLKEERPIIESGRIWYKNRRLYLKPSDIV